ncbi:hypothetical protein [Actinomadura sp. 7K507]|uniref:hypothetical protein n=1 Tax=Actinomadura sp. 7K507 TaxID=2530365 RepID=UPI00104E1AED|nr:hypothetical protein [Actinomadura sp. 7K507]TDC94572.1 hypothetical protein E1285_08560 [Actinomadura sp. 7K507]
MSLLLLLGLTVGGGLLVNGIDAYRAIEGGVPGVFAAERMDGGGRGDRWWVGDFTSDDGSVRLEDVRLAGVEPDAGARPPSPLSAVASGDADADRVYPTGSRPWLKPLIGAVLLLLFCPIGSVLLVRNFRTWRRRQAAVQASGVGEKSDSRRCARSACRWRHASGRSDR